MSESWEQFKAWQARSEYAGQTQALQYAYDAFLAGLAISREYAEAQKLKQETLAKYRDRFKALRRLCGFVENASDTTVAIYQDDATRSWIIRVGPMGNPKNARYFGGSLEEVIDSIPAADLED